ncbi:relaxase/mobilization nuclease domain-containing protein [Streptomyces racemochromogenes]|uniref:relaxase/mobilization nuclease domain-containing protein n=1 Tax=Streptomyces racemochromogenes TaxID=67353 RepID=UPI0035E6CD9C
MIANVTKGARAVGAIRYDFGPGRRDEHLHPRVIAGTVVGTPMQIARAVDYTASRRPDVVTPIWRASLSLPDEDGVLTDDQWAEMAGAFIERMGYADVPWVAVRHGDDHVHLTVSRVGWDGQLRTDRHDYRRAREACDELEERHGLVRARDRFDPEGPQVRNAEREAAARRRGRGVDGPPPEREELRRIVREVREASRGLGREAFEAGLADAGISFRANTARTGRMSGYSFTVDGWTDGTGQQVWVAASKVARDLRWAELGPAIAEPPRADIPDPRIEMVAPTVTAPVQPAIPDPRIALGTPALTAPAAPVLSPEQLAQAAERGAALLRQGQAERGVVPAGDPARSPDPAARLLAQWRAKADGQAQDEEVVRPPAPRAPAWTDRERRPHGRLGTDRLAAEIKKLEKAVKSLAAARSAAEKEIRAGEALATGEKTGPHTLALHERLRVLEEAEPQITAAAHHAALARAADQAADAARTEWREAEALRRRSRLELWRLGTSRAAEEARAQTASATIGESTRTATDERRAADELRREVRKRTGLVDAEAQLARLRGEWEQLLDAAQGQDRAAGHTRRDTGTARAAQITAQITQAEARIGQVRQEQEVRRTMPEGQRRAEGRARSAAAHVDREAAEAARLGALGYPQRPGTPGKLKPRPGTPTQSERPAHLRQPPPPNRGRGHGL